MSERELQRAVIECAHVFNWRVAHFRTAMGKKGRYMTPVAADGAGFPDLCMVRGDRLVFAELKVGYNKPSEEQAIWMQQLDKVAEVYLWRERHWLEGVVEEVLQ